MKIIVAITALLIALSLQAEDKDIIRDKSPDGKFALRITKEDEGWAAAITNLKNKEDVVGLEIYQNYADQAHLVWSKDSQRVAYFEPDRRGGSTSVYFRKARSSKKPHCPPVISPSALNSGLKQIAATCISRRLRPPFFL